TCRGNPKHPWGDRPTCNEESAVVAGEEAQDAELISRVRSGDRSAFGELFTRHHSAALKAATRFCAGTRTSAEDCVSDAFTQILAALQRGKGPDEFFRAYLYTV